MEPLPTFFLRRWALIGLQSFAIILSVLPKECHFKFRCFPMKFSEGCKLHYTVELLTEDNNWLSVGGGGINRYTDTVHFICCFCNVFAQRCSGSLAQVSPDSVIDGHMCCSVLA